MATARLKDKLKQTARTTTQAARAAADKSAQKAGAKKQQEKPAKSTPVRNVKSRAKGMTQKAQTAAKEQNRTPRRKPSVQAAGKQAAQKVKGSQKVKDYQKMNQAGLQSLSRSRFAQDMAARQAVRQDNIGRGTNLPQRSTGILKDLGMEKYREPGRKENNPNTPAGMYKTTLPESDLDRITKDADLRQKNYGLDGEKVPTRDIIDSANLDPLSALKADSMSHANFGRGKGAKIAQKEKTDKELVQEAVDRLTAHTRKRGARQQTLSRHDNKLRAQMRDEIKLAKQDYDTAKRKGDTEGMAKAHQRAETIRRQEGGYSGGATGADYETPEISREDRATLNKEGLTRLAAAKLGYDNAKTDEERERYQKQGADIRKSARYQREEYDRGAYRETDANGRMRYAGTAEERQKEQEQAAAIPQAILTGLGGSFASLPEGTLRALQADAARNQGRLQALSDIRGGGEINVSEPGKIDPNSLGQRLLRQSQEYREKATEGQKGLERYLTEALITGGEMAPGLIATALTGGAAAPGLAVMGAQAAGQRMGDLNAQGVDPVQAFNRGILSGAIEAGSELIPLRNLAKIARGGGDNFARNLATQALEEVGTEEASEIGNYLADRAFRDPNASLTARDLMDTAAISALTSIGMGAGAGIIGTRRAGQRTEQDAKTITAMDQVTPTVDALAEAENAIQQRVQALHAREQEALAMLTRNSDNPQFFKHFQDRLNQIRQEHGQLQADMIGLEMQKQQRTRVEQEKAQQAQRQAEEAQRAEQERLEAAQRAQEETQRAQSPVQAPQEAAQQPQTNPVREQATEPVQTKTPTEGQETARATSQQYDQPENHIDNRTSETLGGRRTKAFQWDHPEVKPFYQDAARALRQDVEASMASARNVRASQHNQSLGKQAGTIMDRNEPLRQLHEMGLSSTEILKGLDAIIRDDGAENIASAKRVELALDDMLSNGYIPVEAGGNPDAFVGPNRDYIQAKSRITGGTEQGSFEEYLRDNALSLELGEVTEDELRAEWEAARSSTQQTAEESTEDTSSPMFQTKEEELAYLRGRAESLISQREQAANGTEVDQARWDREWNQLNADIQAAQERWSGQEEETETEEERYSVGAAPGGFDPFSRLANEYGTIEPGENPARMVDVPVSTNGEDRVRRYARTAMEAEVTPDEAMSAFEQDVVNGLFSYHPRRDADAMAAARNTIESKGYDGALQQWNDVVEGRRIAGKDDVVLAQMLYSLAAQNGDINTVRRLAAEIAAEGTVSGQKIQALRLLKKATPEGKLYYIRKTVGKLQDDLNRSRGDKAPTLEIDPELEEALLDADTQEEQQDILDRIYDHVAKQIPATLGDRLNAWRYFAMLGNPRTHIRNVVGNIVVQAPLQVSNKVSALAQAALPKEQRTRAVIASREAKRFARDDYQYMKDVLSGDKYISEESEIKRRQTLFPAPIQKAMDFNSKALEAEDMIFKKGTYIQSLASFITARGWDPQTMTAGQLEQARTHAIKDARHATFQNESALASAIAKLERKNRATKVAIGGLVPFKGVPINIAKMGFDLSPAGLAKAITYDATQVKKGNMDATDMIDHLTRGLTGTSVAALGYFLAAQGWLTAGADDDDKENYFNMAQGSQEYALDLGDWSYTIDWAAPSAIPLFLGAEYFNARQKWGEESDDESKAFKDGLESLSRLFDPMLNMTVLSGVSDTLNTISYSQTNPLFPLAWGIGQNYLGQFVPTLSGQIARTVDDTRRTTYVDRESPVPNSIQRFIQRQENKIPGLSQRNLPYLDSWGREDRTENPLLRAFENFLSPGYVSKRNTDAVDEELQRLHDLDYDGVLPSKAQTNTKINDRYLSKDEYEKLVRTQGSQARNMLAEVIGTPEYQGLTDDEKAAYVKKIFDFSKQIGKLEAGMPEEKADSYVLKAKEGQDTLGLDPSKYLAMAALKASIDKDETTDDKTMKAIDFSLAVDARNDMTDEQKAFVKNNIKFFNMFPVSTSGFEKGVAAGLTAEESKAMLALKKTADTDGNNSYTNLEIYDAINNSDLSDEKKAQYWEAMKPANTKKSWTDIQKESKEAAATREKWSSSIGDVSQETIDTFNGNVNSIGGYNSMSYTAFFDMMDSMGVPESQRAGYYAIVQSNKGHPWKKTYAQAKKYKGR